MRFESSKPGPWPRCGMSAGLLLLALLAGLARGEDVAQPAPARGEDELLLFQELPTVISASRKVQPAQYASVPTSVVSAEDLHHGGFVNAYEALQFVPGVDYGRPDRNRVAIGVRGLHDTLSDRTLLLIDGRQAESPVFGGAEWTRNPLLIEDIDRIEVVRGPGGAAWGANAFNGTINVITKTPEQTQGVLATGTANAFGDVYAHVRWGAKRGAWAWRTSFGYQDEEASDEAIHDDGFFSRDFNRRYTFDGQAARKIGADTRLSIGTGHQYQQLGDYEVGNYFLREDGRLDSTRAFVRADHKVNSKLSGYVQWTGNFNGTDRPALQKGFAAVNDLEVQADYTPAAKHQLTIGGNVRWMELTTDVKRPGDIRTPSTPNSEYFKGLFVLHRWEALERLTIETQARGDWYSETHGDWASRLTALVTLDECSRHVLRASAARSFRAPYIGLQDIQIRRLPLRVVPGVIPPGTFAQNAFPAELENEQIYALEAGYHGVLAEGVTLNLDGYYHRYKDLIGFAPFQVRTLPFGLGTIPFVRARNDTGADAWGGELELAVTRKLGRASAWFAYNDYEQDEPQRPVRAMRPARFKAGFTGRLFLPEEVTLNLAYRYSDVTRGDFNNQFNSIPPYHRLDFTAGKRFQAGRYELQVGAHDLLNTKRDAVRGLGAQTEHETPGRTFFIRLELKF